MRFDDQVMAGTRVQFNMTVQQLKRGIQNLRQKHQAMAKMNNVLAPDCIATSTIYSIYEQKLEILKLDLETLFLKKELRSRIKLLHLDSFRLLLAFVRLWYTIYKFQTDITVKREFCANALFCTFHDFGY